MQVADDEIYLVVNAGCREKDLAHINKYLEKFQVSLSFSITNCLGLPQIYIRHMVYAAHCLLLTGMLWAQGLILIFDSVHAALSRCCENAPWKHLEDWRSVCASPMSSLLRTRRGSTGSEWRVQADGGQAEMTVHLQ